ncbi:MAG TPA: hypothetical protein VFW98_08445 [Gemmatimonadaceae bacterium]|nr:hypothetical protein [Gemmatimonadaceae bacterium]
MASVVVAWNTGDRLVTFADVFGSTVTIPVENIESIWDSDRELRERGRLFLRAVDAEVPEWERGDE